MIRKSTKKLTRKPTGRSMGKPVLFVSIILLICLATASTGFATGSKAMLEAWYMNIKIKNNGQEVFPDKAPFIVDGTTYVSVRTMANIFNKDIEWDGVNYIVSVNDKPGQGINYLNMQLMMKDSEIKYLEDRIKDLEKKSDPVSNIDDLEDDLNYDHDEYKGVDFDIKLSGKKSDITVIIEFSLKRDKTSWNKLTEKNIINYLEDICDDILDVFPKADIAGYFKDSSKTTSSKMYKFSTTSKGRVTLDSTESGKGTSFRDFEYDLNDMFYDYFDDVGFDMDIELEGDEDDITFNVYMDYDRYKSKWNRLDDEDIEYLMEDIYWEIEDEFWDADIEGYIYDWDGSTELAEYVKSGRSMRFRRFK